MSRLRALRCAVAALAAFACALIPASAGAFELLQSWGNSGAGMFGPQVVGLATDAHGDVYVVDGESTSRIEEFSANGTFLTEWGTNGPGAGQMDYPISIAVAAGGPDSGDLYVTDAGNYRVDEFEPDGHFLRTWGFGVGKAHENKFEICEASCVKGWPSGTDEGGFEGASGIAIDPSSGDVYVSDAQGNLFLSIQKFAPDGEKMGTVGLSSGSFGTDGGAFLDPTALATDATGDLYVVDAGNERIQELNPSGTFMRLWGRGVLKGESGTGEKFAICTKSDECQQGGQGEAAGDFDFIARDAPASIAIDSSGNVWVPDGGNLRVQEFTSTGEFVMGFGWGVQDGAERKFETCTVATTCRAGVEGPPGQFDNPIGAAAAPSGCTIYVTDANANDLVDEFSCGGSVKKEPSTEQKEPPKEQSPPSSGNVSTAAGASSTASSSSSGNTNNQPPPPPSAAQLEAVLATAFGLPSSNLCYSKRSFKIHIQQPHGYPKVVSADVFLGKKRERSLNKQGLTDEVVLKQLPYGTFTIRIVARTVKGTTLTGTRTYHTCRPKPIHPHGHPHL